MSGETKPDDATVMNDAVDALTNLSVGDAAAGGDAGRREEDPPPRAAEAPEKNNNKSP